MPKTNTKIDLWKYFSKIKLPCGFFLNREAFPKKPVSIRNLNKRYININCTPEARFDCAIDTYLRKIRKIEKMFGVEAVGGGMMIGGNEYDNDFMFTKETIQNMKAVAGIK